MNTIGKFLYSVFKILISCVVTLPVYVVLQNIAGGYSVITQACTLFVAFMIASAWVNSLK
jgi:hypothetical protein